MKGRLKRFASFLLVVVLFVNSMSAFASSELLSVDDLRMLEELEQALGDLSADGDETDEFLVNSPVAANVIWPDGDPDETLVPVLNEETEAPVSLMPDPAEDQATEMPIAEPAETPEAETVERPDAEATEAPEAEITDDPEAEVMESQDVQPTESAVAEPAATAVPEADIPAINPPEIVVAPEWIQEEETMVIPCAFEDEVFTVKWSFDGEAEYYRVSYAIVPEDEEEEEEILEFCVTAEMMVELPVTDFDDGDYTLYIAAVMAEGEIVAAQRIRVERETQGFEEWEEDEYPAASSDVYQHFSGILYKKNESNVTIVGYSGNLGALDIPSTIGGLNVSNIQSGAFRGCSTLTSLTIPDGISIGGLAFADCKSLTQIIFEGSASLDRGSSASFRNCSGVRTVYFNGKKMPVIRDAFSGVGHSIEFVFGSELETIPGNAFYGCQVLNKLTIPDNITEIAGSVFRGSSLKRITVSEQLTSIGSYAFSGSDLEYIEIPDSVVTLGEWAFYQCYELAGVKFGNGITSIPHYAFADCAKLTHFNTPEALKTIGECAFSGCTSLTRLEFPETLTSMDRYAFSGCSGLTYLTFRSRASLSAGSSGSFKNCHAMEKIELYNETAKIGDAFYGVDHTIEFYIDPSITEIASGAFKNCKVIDTLRLPETITMIGSNAFSGSSIREIYLLDGVASIGANAFSNSKLEKIQFPVTVTTIFDSAFSGCAELREVVFAEGLTQIAYAAFKNCAALRDFVLPESIQRIEESAFSGCAVLENVTIPADTYLSDYAFSGCTGLKNLVLNGPVSMCAISRGSFSNCHALEKVYVNNTCPSIRRAFEGVEHPIEFIFDANVTSIPTSAFEDCLVLDRMVLPNSITSIGMYAFRDSSIKNIELSENLTSLGEQAFANAQLEEIHFPNSLAVISKHAFMQNAALETVTFGNQLEQIEYGAFYKCASLKSFELPVTLRGIGDYAFYQCSSIEELVMHGGAIGELAFAYCENLKNVIFTGSVGLHGDIREGSFRFCTSLQNVEFMDTLAPFMKYAFQDVGKKVNYYLGVGNGKISQQAFAYNDTVSEILIPFGVKEILYNAFMASSIASISLPETLERIEGGAFAQCEELAQVRIPQSVTYIENQAFGADPQQLFIVYPETYGAEWAEKNGYKYVFYQQPYVAVEFSEAADAETLAGMTLLLSSGKKSVGQTVDETTRAYVFNALDDAQSYTLSLRDSHGFEIASVEIGYLKPGENHVVLDTFAPVVDYELRLLDADGTNRAAEAKVYWTDTSGELIAVGASLNGISANAAVNYRVVLSESLAQEYENPAKTAQPANSGMTELQLMQLTRLVYSGTVVDEITGEPIVGAEVRFVQELSDGYSVVNAQKTDEEGRFALDCYAVSGEAEISATGYAAAFVPVTEPGDAGEILLRSVNSATILLSASYINAVEAGEVPERIEHYRLDQADVQWKIVNETAGFAVRDIQQSDSALVLLDNFNPGDDVKITLRSLSNVFADVQADVVLDDTNSAAVHFELLQPGSFELTTAGSANGKTLALVFDVNGKLACSVWFDELSVSSGVLAEGEYTVVIIGDHEKLRSVESMDMFNQLGFAQAEDYLSERFVIENGVVTHVSVGAVPALDAEKLSYFVQSKTAVTSSKNSFMVADYTALRLAVRFQDRYAHAENARWIIHLPEGMQFVENSTYAQHIVNGNEIIIYPDDINDVIYLCASANKAGMHTMNVYLQFELDGAVIMQPVSVVSVNVSDMEFHLPAETGDSRVVAHGRIGAHGKVMLYCDGVMKGQAKANGDGAWSIAFDLNESGTYGLHEVYIVQRSVQNVSAKSPTKMIRYNVQTIMPSLVTMVTATNSAYQKVEFDFKNPSSKAPSYNHISTNYTFTIEFDADASALTNVRLIVYQSNGGSKELEAYFDAASGQWIADGVFPLEESPVNVGVIYNQPGRSVTMDLEAFKDAEIDIQEWMDLFEQMQLEEMPEDEADAADEAYLQEFFAAHPVYIEDLPGMQEIIDEYEAEFGETDDGFFNADGSLNLLYEPDLEAEIEQINQEHFSYIDQMLAPYEELSGMNVDLNENGEITIQPSDGTNRLISQTELTQTEEELQDMGFSSYVSTGDKPVLVRYNESNQTIAVADFNTNTYSSYDIVSSMRFRAAGGDAQSMQAALDEALKWLGIMNDAVKTGMDIVDEMELHSPLHKQIATTGRILAEHRRDLRKLNIYIEENGGFQYDFEYEQAVTIAEKKAAALERRISWLTNYRNGLMKLLPTWKTLLSVAEKWLIGLNAILTGYDIGQAIMSIQDLIRLYQGVKGNCAEAIKLRTQITQCALQYGGWIVSKLTLLWGEYTSLVAGVSTSATGVGLVAAIASFVALFAVGVALDTVVKDKIDRWKAVLEDEAEGFKCKEDDDDDGDDGNPDDNTGGNGPKQKVNSPSRDAKVIIDPSGYVYEAVASNRLSGVTATCMEQRTEYDMYDEPYTVIEVWDAAEFGQVNPQITDNKGVYAWDVPAGLWRVRYEKAGYQTAYSDWLVVPPPHLDVNVGMVSYKAPVVSDVIAYDNEILWSFDKYMEIASVSSDSVTVTINGEAVTGVVEAVNAENSPTDATKVFASKFRFVPEQRFAHGDVPQLWIAKTVRSYAGVTMRAEHTQQTEVIVKVEQLTAPEQIEFSVGEVVSLDICAEPAGAAAGKQLMRISPAAGLLHGVPEEILLDENGCASIALVANYAGVEMLEFKLAGTDLTATTVVQISRPTETILSAAEPIASAHTGSVLPYGTMVELASGTAGATIYYTLDGSCPCDEEARIEYNGPVMITRPCVLKAMAVRNGLADSEVAKFSYVVAYDPTEAMEISAASNLLGIGGTMQLNAVTEPISASPEMQWNSQNPDIATVDDNGVVTGVKAGKAIITAATTDGTNITSQIELTVGKYVTGITLTGAEMVAAGKSITLKATVTPSSAKNRTVVWSSSDTAVAKVSTKGVVTAAKGITEPKR